MSDIIGHNEPIVEIVCNSCVHYNVSDFKHFSCAAFNDIPKEILSGKNMHLKPLIEQKNNIIFDKLISSSEVKEIKDSKNLKELMSTDKGRNFWKEKGFQYHGTFNVEKDYNGFMNYFNKKFKE